MLKKYVLFRTLQKVFKSEIYLLPRLDSLLNTWSSCDEPSLDEILGPDQQKLFETLYRSEEIRAQQDLNFGFSLIHWGHTDYPYQLYHLVDPPLTLMYKGAPSWLHTHSLSIVGSREPHPLSVEWTPTDVQV